MLLMVTGKGIVAADIVVVDVTVLAGRGGGRPLKIYHKIVTN